VGTVRDFVLDLAQILLRALPWSAKSSLIRIGHPGRDAPVLVTCNYDLTVRRVLRALRGLDAYLLVAPTKGINVWCGAAGGYFTAHQVISILRTSEIGELVDHRRLILPQLSATGVERKLVCKSRLCLLLTATRSFYKQVVVEGVICPTWLLICQSLVRRRW
jgi:CO dehydrogenase/acetyl-CoA synthase delta subunit